MTPKDKATILVSDFERYLPDGNWDTKTLAKKLAWIAVYEVKTALVGCHTAEEYGDYWEKVRIEIGKI